MKKKYKEHEIRVLEFTGLEDKLYSLVKDYKEYDAIMLKNFINENSKNSKTLIESLNKISNKLKYNDWEIIKDFKNYILVRGKHIEENFYIYLEVRK